MDLESTKTRNNPDNNRFELLIRGETAFIDYTIGKSGSWYLIHTEVPESIEEKGVGTKLVRESLHILDDMDVKIIPSCPFIKAYIKRNQDQYQHLLADGFKI